MQPAMILFAHGSRDPKWREPFDQLHQRLCVTLNHCTVKLAFLELMTPTLETCINELAQTPITEITIVPVFLGQGGHLRRDLPQLIAQCQQQHPHLTIRCAPAIGESELVLNAICDYCAAELEASPDSTAGIVERHAKA